MNVREVILRALSEQCTWEVAPVIEVLAPEENDLPAQESIVDYFPDPHVERPTKIDARDLGTDVQRERLHFDHARQVRHDRLLEDMS